jgi:hypothetical protein
MVLYSYDGINWTKSTSGSSFGPLGYSRTLGTDGNIFLTIGYRAAFVYTSTNGIDWIQTSIGSILFDSEVTTIAYNGQIWVAGGSTTNTIAYSTNGLSWTGSALFPSICNAVAWNGTLWVAAGGINGTSIAYSYNGINWTASASANAIFTREAYTVNWNGTIWTATGRDNTSFTNRVINSFDGINWTANTAANSIIGGATTIASRRAPPYIGQKIQGPMGIRYGSGTTNGVSFNLPVTFGTPFTSRPNVTAVVTNGSASWVSVGSVGATGFTAYTWDRLGATGSIPFNWQAIL